MADIETIRVAPEGSSNVQPGVRVNDHTVQLADWSPTGRQVLAAAGMRPEAEFALLLWPLVGPTREVGLEEVMELPSNGGTMPMFFAIRADRVLYFVLDDERYAWAGGLDGGTIRRLGRVPQEKELWWERRDVPDQLLEPEQTVDLNKPGVERFYTREKVWRLDVQGELTIWNQPSVVVKDALIKAGVDLTKAWTIVLKVKGKESRQVKLDDIIDLTEPGIERLWLRPRKVNNGDGSVEWRREFSLLPKDETFLASTSHDWETVLQEGRRWLIITGYGVPPGYNVATCRLALEIPRTYPTSEINMFYCDPPLVMAGGKVPAATEAREIIAGVSFQRWSRHRDPGQWSPTRDGVATHLGLVDEALAREVGV